MTTPTIEAVKDAIAPLVDEFGTSLLKGAAGLLNGTVPNASIDRIISTTRSHVHAIAQAAIDAHLKALSEAGMVCVPRVATERMLSFASRQFDDDLVNFGDSWTPKKATRRAWDCMISAAMVDAAREGKK